MSEEQEIEPGSSLADVWAGTDEVMNKALAEDNTDADDEDFDDEDLSDEEDPDEEDGEDPDEEDEEDPDEEDPDEEDEEDPDEENDEEGGKPDKDTDDKEAVGTLAAKTSDGKTIDIPEDATFRWKANGKNRQVTLAELKRDFGGRVAYDEKIRQANDIKRKYEDLQLDSDMQISLIKDSLEAAEQGDVGACLEAIGEVLGLEPGEYFDTMIGAFDKLFTKLASETPAERRATVAEAKSKGITARTNRAVRKAEEKTLRTQFTAELKEGADKYDISDEEMDHSYKHLMSKAAAVEKESGQKQQVTANSVVRYALDRRIVNRLQDAIDDLELNLADDDLISLFRLLKEVDPDVQHLSLEDYKEVVKEAVGESPKKRLRRKARKKATPQKVRKSKRDRSEEALKKAKSLNDLWNQAVPS